MRVLKFIINGQKIEKDPACDFDNIVAGTEGYLQAEFYFSGEWNGCKKAAVFYSLGKEHAQPVINGKCEIPAEALKWDKFGVRVVGQKENYRITTGEIKVNQERR